MSDVEMVILPSGEALCLDGKHKGRLFEKQPDGQWESKRMLEVFMADLTTVVRAKISDWR